MQAPKAGQEKLSAGMAASDDNPGKQKMKPAGRRLADSLKPNSRKLKLERRNVNTDADRRIDTGPQYEGPARRKNIDRREKTKDRRDE